MKPTHIISNASAQLTGNGFRNVSEVSLLASSVSDTVSVSFWKIGMDLENIENTFLVGVKL